MLCGKRLWIVLSVFFGAVICNIEDGRHSVRSRSRQQRKSPLQTIDIRDEGAKRYKNTFILNMTMPGAHSVKAEEYLCTSSRRLSSRHTSYIVGYEPHAHSSTAHHILLFGCRYPASRANLFRCPGSVCRGEERIIYAWAKDAKALKMPKGVGFAVGGHTGINYITMQVHYARALEGAERDYSGIDIHMTQKRVQHLAEIYMMGSGEAKIPPKSIRFHANFACRYNRPYDMVPFAFRTHAHSTGRVISGYRVRKGKWKLIGINSPQRPQAFYPIPPENRTIIHKGDIMAGRCTYDTSHRNRWTVMGPTSKDEMCNLYFMYYKVYRKGKAHSQRWYESECLDIEDGISLSSLKFPANSDKLPVGMKIAIAHGHHHNHHGMMGDDDEMMGGHDWLMGNDMDRERDEQDGEDENDDDSEPGDDDFDDERNWLSDGSKSKKNSSPSVDELDTGFDLESPDGNDLDDRLIQEGSDSGAIKPTELSPGVDGSEQKGDIDQKSTGKDSKHTGQHSRKNFHEDIDSDLDNLVPAKNDHIDLSHAIETPMVDGDWPYSRESWKDIGQVSALGMDGKYMLLLHRGNRVWDGRTFDDNERLVARYRRSKIADPAVLNFDPSTGKITKRWGEHRFYLPHGLTVDIHGNIWITDVGAHQVYKFARDNLSKPALTLGVALRPGSDDRHFCKPADVAVESNGDFFVADGYCNNRVMKFSANGKLIKKWGKRYRGHGTPGPFEFHIPHSLALDEKKQLIYVANRELGRIHCFTTQGKFVNMIHRAEFGGRLFAVSFTQANGGLLYAVSGKSFEKNGPSPSGFTIHPKSKQILKKWSPFRKGFTRPHDVHVLADGSAVFVSEIGPNRVWKFNIHKSSKIQNSTKSQGNHFERLTSKTESTLQDEESNKGKGTDPPYKLKMPNENDSNIIPALVIVVVLATPIALICAAATIQHLRFKYRKEKVLHLRNKESLSSKSGRSGGCFGRTKTYYHDDRRGFDKLIGEDNSDESEDDYFVRKGAI